MIDPASVRFAFNSFILFYSILSFLCRYWYPSFADAMHTVATNLNGKPIALLQANLHMHRPPVPTGVILGEQGKIGV